jgi:hypothetical protein
MATEAAWLNRKNKKSHGKIKLLTRIGLLLEGVEFHPEIVRETSRGGTFSYYPVGV